MLRERPNAAVMAVAAALACSPLAYGFYDLTVWAPLGLGAAVLLVVLVFIPPGRLDGPARVAVVGMVLLLALSFASIAWAQSRESAWTSANRLAVYAIVFGIGVVALRTRVTAWSAMTLLGLPALVTALVLAVLFIIGGGSGAFVHGRLDAPMGYVNGTAALLVMGAWPWLGLAERLRSRWWRGGALGAAALIASAAVLTETRAIVLAAAASIVLALLSGTGRGRRGANLLVVLAAVAASAYWTLRVYGSTGPTHLAAPGAGALRGAGLALLGVTALAFTGGIAMERAWPTVSSVLRRIHGRPLRVTMVAVIVLALTAGATIERRSIVAQWHDFTTLNAERSATNRFLAPGGGPRYDLWRIALDEFAGNPVGGVGAGNYADQEFRRRHGLEHVTTPHSLELQMLAELGVGGAVGLLLFVLPVLATGHARPRNRLAARDGGLRASALGMFAAWLAGTSVDWLYDIPGLTGMAMLAAAVLLVPADTATAPAASRPGSAAADPRGSVRARGSLRSPAMLGLALVLMALLAASLGRQYVATLYRDSGQALERHSVLTALGKLRTAEALDPWSLQTQYAVASAYARANDYPAARAALLRAQRLEPENFVPPALLGDIALRAGHRRVALVEYRRALRLDPRDPSLKRAVRAVGGAGGSGPDGARSASQSAPDSRANSAS